MEVGMVKQGFLAELVRRKVVKVTVSYIAVAWVLIQVADIALESFGAPAYFMQAFMLFAVLGVPIVLLLSWALEVTPEGIRRETGSRTGEPLRHAIAVLPFANMSSDVEVEHMADGLSDHIITGCQQQLGMDVTSRNSTFVYKNQPVSIANVARELNVAYVLEGGIQKQANKVRVTAQLINAANDSHLWADSFDRDLVDTFRVQDELTKTIVTAMKAVLPHSPDSQDAVAPEPGLLTKFMALPPFLVFTLIGVTILLMLLAIVPFLPGSIGSGLEGISFELAGSVLLLATITGLFGYYAMRRIRSPGIDVGSILEQIEDHVTHGHFAEAFDLAEEIASHLSDTEYPESWWDQFSAKGTLRVEPSSAHISWRPYNGRNVPWRKLGKAPIIDIRLPISSLQLKIEHPGYQTQEFATGNPGIIMDNSPLVSDTSPELVALREKASVLVLSKEPEDGMVYASERPVMLGLSGMPFLGPVIVKQFYIDQDPVSNSQFQRFVDAGGYSDETFWQNLPWPRGQGFSETVSRFVDRTDRPGPATWELGRFPERDADLPVTGVSWYEAMAYARFAGKRLPNVYEWCRAALPLDAGMTSITVAMMNFSNFLGEGKNAPGDFPSLSAIGANDMFGNVREWSYNEVTGGRANLGGCDTDLAYFAVWLNTEDPLSREDFHGFRCAKGSVDEALQAPIVRSNRTYEDEEPVSGDVYDALVQPLTPRHCTTNARQTRSKKIGDGILVETFEIDSGYGERIALNLTRPTNPSGPVPTLVVFPGMNAMMGGELEEDCTSSSLQRLDFLVSQLGYALVTPNWQGSYERFDFGPFPQGRDDARDIWLTRVRRWVQEASQAVTFSEENENLDGDRVGFLGISYGAIHTMPILALEQRIRTVLLFSGNMLSHHFYPFADAMNFYPRITCPVLMINGRYDSIVSANEELFDLRLRLLGTPDNQKKQVLYDAGHFPFPQHLFKKEVADWLKEYL